MLYKHSILTSFRTGKFCYHPKIPIVALQNQFMTSFWAGIFCNRATENSHILYTYCQNGYFTCLLIFCGWVMYLCHVEEGVSDVYCYYLYFTIHVSNYFWHPHIPLFNSTKFRYVCFSGDCFSWNFFIIEIQSSGVCTSGYFSNSFLIIENTWSVWQHFFKTFFKKNLFRALELYQCEHQSSVTSNVPSATKNRTLLDT